MSVNVGGCWLRPGSHGPVSPPTPLLALSSRPPRGPHHESRLPVPQVSCTRPSSSSPRCAREAPTCWPTSERYRRPSAGRLPDPRARVCPRALRHISLPFPAPTLAFPPRQRESCETERALQVLCVSPLSCCCLSPQERSDCARSSAPS